MALYTYQPGTVLITLLKFPEASALTFLSSIQMPPALNQNVLWENWRWW